MQIGRRLDALTGLRFFAAMLIVVHHLQGRLWLPPLSNEFSLGGGVSFFFVLSGFILHYNYRDKIGSIPWPAFMWMRFFRLWPAHVAAIGYVFFLAGPWWVRWISENLSAIQVAQVVFLLQSITPDRTVFFAINGPSWSVSTELFFYAAFPLLCTLGRKNIFTMWASVTAFVAAYLIFAQAFLLDPSIPGNAGGLFYISPLSRIFEFATGIFVCEIVMFRRPITLPARPIYLETVAWLSVFAALWLQAQCQSLMMQTFGPVVGGYLYIAVPVPAFCALIAITSFERGAISRVFMHPWVVWLGCTSFALYLVHQPTIHFFRRYMADLPVWQQVPLFVGMVLGVSALIFYTVELRGIRLSRQYLETIRAWVMSRRSTMSAPSAGE